MLAGVLSCGVADGCDQEFQVPVVQAGNGLAEGDERAVGDAGGELEMRCSPLQTGICPSWRAVSAACQSIQAIRVVSSLMLVPVCTKLAKSSRCRMPPWPMSSSVPASSGCRPAA